MNEHHVAGTAGYDDATQRFISATLELDFRVVHQPFLPFIPLAASRVLDVGAGIGRDAFVLSQMGHAVTAVEPTQAFITAAGELYPESAICWVNDALPALELVENHPFDFILASGVWHHLNEREQQQAIARVAQLLRPGGVFALTLRNGPAGAGTHVFPTNHHQLIETAACCGLAVALLLENQPSLMKNKEQVFWTKLVLTKK